MKPRIYFDMDGVLFDWVDMYNQRNIMSLDQFSNLSRSDREEVKVNLFDFDFFADMKVIQKGYDLLKYYISEGYDVSILSATGRVNKDEVMRGKLASIEKNLGKYNIPVYFVDKVEMKDQYVQDPSDILIDDRQIAIDSWVSAGGVGILFK